MQSSIPLHHDILRVGRPTGARNPVRISYSLNRTGEVNPRVLDILGRTVRILFEGQQEPGEHLTTWDGRTETGEDVPSGAYLVQLQTGGFRASRRLVRLR